MYKVERKKKEMLTCFMYKVDKKTNEMLTCF